MRFAVIIVTYSAVELTKRIIDKLDNGRFDFYIHLDKKVDLSTHAVLKGRQNVFFAQERIDVKWAGFSTTEAALSCLREIKKSGKQYGFVHLITGQDYPIKSADYISRFLENNAGKEFIYYKYFTPDWEEAWARVENYHFTDFRFRGRHSLATLLNTVMPKRKFPRDMRLCGKETFWSLSQECALYVLDVLDTDHKLRRFLRFCWGSDEFIFQTIIMNSPFKEKVVNNNFRHIVWPKGSARPLTFKSENLPELLASNALFARKFDWGVDNHVFDLLDEANSKQQ